MRRTLLASVLVPLALSCGGSDPTAGSIPTDASVMSTDSVGARKMAGVVIDVTVGEDSDDDRVVSVALGASVTLNITNPSADDEFHLHGYDLSVGETQMGETASLTFTADKAGEFEVESHATDAVILRIVVS
jgi:hypothetical protein